MKGFIVSSVAVSTLIIVVFLMSGCIDGEELPILDFETLSKENYNYGYTTPQEFVINDKETFNSFWVNVHYNGGNVSIHYPKVDFSNSTVIAVFMGEKPTGGYGIEIMEILDIDAEKLFVFVIKTIPSDDCMVTEALTQPYHIIKTSKIYKEVKFVHHSDPIIKCD